MISFDLSVFIAPSPCFMPCRRLCYLDFLRDVSSVLLLFILRSRVFSGCLVPFATFFRGCPVVTSDFLGDVLDGLQNFVFHGFMVFVTFFGMYCTVCYFFSILTVIFSLNFRPKFYVSSKKGPKVLFSLRRSWNLVIFLRSLCGENSAAVAPLRRKRRFWQKFSRQMSKWSRISYFFGMYRLFFIFFLRAHAISKTFLLDVSSVLLFFGMCCWYFRIWPQVASNLDCNLDCNMTVNLANLASESGVQVRFRLSGGAARRELTNWRVPNFVLFLN